MSRSILLADDSVTIQKVIELTFMDEDYRVTAVSNGDEAVARLPELGPDLVIADVHMPGANGYEVCRRAKALRPDVPVLLLVGTFEPFDEAQAVAAGADAHLKKPFDSQELLRLVEELLGPAAAPFPASPAEEPFPEAEPVWSNFDLDDRGAAAGGFDEAAAPAAPFYTPEESFVVEAEELVVEDPYELPPPSFAPEPGLSPVEPFGGAEARQSEVRSVGFQPFDTTPEERVGAIPGAPYADSLGEVEEQIEEREEAHGGDAWAPSSSPWAGAPSSSPWATGAPEAPAPAASSPWEPAPLAAPAAGGALSDDDVDRIARRIVELIGDRAVRDVAWEVVPDLAEVIIRDRLRELESQVE